MDETYDTTGLFTCVINVEGPGEILGNPDSKEFDRGNPLNWLMVEEQLHMRKRISLSRDNHGFGFGGICRKVVVKEPAMDSIDVGLEIGQIGRLGNWLVKSGVVGIQNQGAV
jgi:hypothetical protein